MFSRLDTFEERDNSIFVSMLDDLNPKIYQISTDRFVFQRKESTFTGSVNIPNAHIIIFNNGVEIANTDADGNGDFSLPLRLVDNVNELVVDYN